MSAVNCLFDFQNGELHCDIPRHCVLPTYWHDWSPNDEADDEQTIFQCHPTIFVARREVLPIDDVDLDLDLLGLRQRSLV